MAFNIKEVLAGVSTKKVLETINNALNAVARDKFGNVKGPDWPTRMKALMVIKAMADASQEKVTELETPAKVREHWDKVKGAFSEETVQ